jgi:hypothetical protein
MASITSGRAGRLLLGGVCGTVVGSASALVNALYFLGFCSLTGSFSHPTSLSSVALSSLLPSVLGGLGYGALTWFSTRAGALFAAVTATITLLSFAQLFQDTLPGGVLKPPGFDALVLPMHVVVGSLAAYAIPRLFATVSAFEQRCHT